MAQVIEWTVQRYGPILDITQAAEVSKLAKQKGEITVINSKEQEVPAPTHADDNGSQASDTSCSFSVPLSFPSATRHRPGKVSEPAPKVRRF